MYVNSLIIKGIIGNIIVRSLCYVKDTVVIINKHFVDFSQSREMFGRYTFPFPFILESGGFSELSKYPLFAAELEAMRMRMFGFIKIVALF